MSLQLLPENSTHSLRGQALLPAARGAGGAAWNEGKLLGFVALLVAPWFRCAGGGEAPPHVAAPPSPESGAFTSFGPPQVCHIFFTLFKA